jgi:hypothetical protein
MKGILKLAAALFFAVCLVQTVDAATIDYNLTFDGDGWRYDYTITNDTQSNMNWFIIYFDNIDYDGLFDIKYESVSLISGLDNWSLDTSLMDPYYLEGSDPRTLIPGQLVAWDFVGLMSGETLEFSIGFNWLGVYSEPVGGSQEYVAMHFNFDTGEILAYWDGKTLVSEVYADTPEVPEPGTLALLGTGILGIAAFYRRSRKAGK